MRILFSSRTALSLVAALVMGLLMSTRALASGPSATLAQYSEGELQIFDVSLGDPGFTVAWWTITWDDDGTDSYGPDDINGDPVFKHYFLDLPSGGDVTITLTVGDGMGNQVSTVYNFYVWADH